MFEARADVTVPATSAAAYAAVSDLEHADWLPAVRGLRHIGGPKHDVGARYEVEAGMLGRHLRGILVCREAHKPSHMMIELEEGLDLKISVDITEVGSGCNIEIVAKYSVGAGPLAIAAGRASQGAARREVARAVEQLSARLVRQ